MNDGNIISLIKLEKSIFLIKTNNVLWALLYSEIDNLQIGKKLIELFLQQK
jgi:hypothetical protein